MTDTMQVIKDGSMDSLGDKIDELLQLIYGREMAFVLGVFEFDKEGLATYITNAKKEGLVESLREIADKVESAEGNFPEIKGTA